MSTTTVTQTIAERIERELDRMKAARPALAARADRAGNILVTHLSCRRQRVIRVRVCGGQPRFLVSGSAGAVYVVDPASWACTCPDHHRRGAGCKHSIACWALWRASARPVLPVPTTADTGEVLTASLAEESGPYELRECPGCFDGRVYDEGRGSWVAHDACSGTGRAMAFVYAKAPKAGRLRKCAGCGERFASRELVEISPEVAGWSLTVGEGDAMCCRCAIRHGVL